MPSPVAAPRPPRAAPPASAGCAFADALVVYALALAVALVAIGAVPRPAAAQPDVQPAMLHHAAHLGAAPARIAANDNRTPAGTLRDGVLTVRLEARAGRWHPEADDGPSLDVQAFGEAGHAATIPGPLIRVRAGTTVRAIVRNALDAPLVLHGLHARPGDATDTVQVAPGAEREVRFVAGAPGTYYYWGSTSGLGMTDLRDADSQLSGALVVDPAEGPIAEDRVFVMGIWFRPEPEQFVMVVNGRSWPHTERLTFTVGDTVRWRWINASESAHPMHLHGFYFDVASRGAWAADTAYAPGEPRRVVTELMPPGGTMMLRWVPERAGNWVFHCHFGFHVSHFLALPAAAGSVAADAGAAEHAGHAAGAGEPATAAAGSAPHTTAHRMAGLVLGLHVRPRPGAVAAAPVEPRRRLRLLAQQRARVWGDSAGMSFVAHEGGPEPARDSVTRVSPTLVLARDEPVAITVVNRLDEPTIVHWHGIELESFPDGVPDWSGDSVRTLRHVAPGDSFTVQFTPPRAGTFIYHSHSNETRQISSGLYGALLVVEPGTVPDTASERLILVGAGGPEFTAPGVVNGAVDPPPLELEAGRTYRLRLVNLNMDWRVTFRLGTDTTVARWTALAKDGAVLPPSQATERPAFLLTGPGETADFAFTPTRPGNLQLDVATQLSGWRVAQRVRVRAPAPPRRVTSSLPVVPAAANDNRIPAGTQRGGVRTVALTARMAAWRPDPDVDTTVTVRAFADGDGAPRVPGPLLRVAQGTELRVRVRNTFDGPLVVHGLRAGTVRDDTVHVAPGAEREVRFTAGAAGTYTYRGATATPERGRVLTDGDARRDAQLVGAIVVDPAGAAPDTAERIFVVTLVDILPDTTRPAPHEDVWEVAINGRSWPHTERLRYAVGDTVRWRWVNASDRSHPMHLHGFHFRTLAAGDGATDTTFATDAVREVVTELMPAGSTFRMAWVPTRAGNWLMHCHMLAHVTPFPARPDSVHSHDLHDVARHPLTAMAGLVLGVTTVERAGAVAAAPRTPTRHLRVVARRAPADSGRLAPYAYAVHDADAPSTSPRAGDALAPSPPLVLTRGETTAITVVNALAEPTTVHWHGMELESVYDGVSGWSGAGSNLAPLLAPGDSFAVAFTPPRAGTFIYHTHMDEGAQLRGGLYGPLIVVEPGETYDPATDIPIVVGRVVVDGKLAFGANGLAAHPPLELQVGTAYRFRFVNILPEAPMQVVLQRDSVRLQWTPEAKDGADLPPALRRTRAARLVLGVGETQDVSWVPDAPGDAELLVGEPDGPAVVRVAIRVRR